MGNVQMQPQMGGCMEVKVEKISENKEEKPKETVLKVYMHCEGCGSKVFNSIKGLPGVEEIRTDVKHNRVIVKGQNADPLKVLERVQKKFSKNAELLYPKPKLKANDVKEEPKKQEPQVKVFVLKMYMHCEGCANNIKKYIQRMKGIISVEPDMNKSTVTIRGTMDPQKLAQTINKRLGKYVEVVGGGSTKGNKDGKGKKGKEEEIIFHYPPQYSAQHIYPTQIFSDENIFSCTIM